MPVINVSKLHNGGSLRVCVCVCVCVCEQGRQVVEVLSGTKVAFSTLKGFLGDEQAVSRCSLVTVATELVLQSGRIEGALKTLRGMDSLVCVCVSHFRYHSD